MVYIKALSFDLYPFFLYTQPLTSVIFKHPVSHVLYADDTQVYKSFDLGDCLSSILCVEKCVSDVKAWMTSNKLQMNEDKTEVLLVIANRVVNLQYLSKSMNINGTCVKFSPSFRNFGRFSRHHSFATSACHECL